VTVTVLVADDQDAVRSGLVLILGTAPDIEVVGEARDGLEAVTAARRLNPDVVLMDVRMPGRDGIAATRDIVAEGGSVLILTTFDIDEYVFGALRAGAAGFLLKDVDAAGLIDAVHTVARGDGVIAPAVTRRLIAAFAATTPALDLAALRTLTARDRAGPRERRDRHRPGHGRVDGEDPREPRARQARRADPGAGRDRRPGNRPGLTVHRPGNRCLCGLSWPVTSDYNA
jgi:DNA-binding NarL/FixJ family response regulator